ncbi:6-phosphofructokinase [Geomonas subterranea]|uniref:6-phosphofructokinase n=1 Tax=Geomonas subterranea TaxID=2847989 RepID=A0ABX8LPH0_9BACT|nr:MULTISPECIES: 6-phosphofructokinase [Geomonas]QXE92590.1 6-phosphofructokinase [Geomonas subterranea]QXM09312.1 6-phosphofructokinase [Geomonas subterranea]
MADRQKTVGVLTGGGDVPGLNPALKTLVTRASENGCRVVGIRRGWGGLLNYNRDDPESWERTIMPLDRHTVRTVDRSGGTFLHTSRTNPGKVAGADVPVFLRGDDFDPASGPHDFTPHILSNLEHLGIDVLIPIGGDDTLSYAERLNREGVPVVAIPKTMDNDVFGTDYCIGFSTAVTRSVNFIHNLRTSAGSHERIAVVELFGRNSGETSLISAYLAGVDRALISEVPFDVEKLSLLLQEDKKSNRSNYAMVTISEGASMVGGQIVEYGQEDAYGHKKLGGIGVVVSEAVKQLTGSHIIYQQLSYLMRSGAPDSLDLMVAYNYANMTMDLITEGMSGRMVAMQGGTYRHIPISTIMQGEKRVDVAELYDAAEYRPKVRHVLGKPMFLY